MLRPLAPVRLDRALERLLDEPLETIERQEVSEVARLLGVKPERKEPAGPSLAEELMADLLPYVAQPDILRPARAISLLREMIQPGAPDRSPASVETMVGDFVLRGELYRFEALHASANALVKG